MRAVVVAAVVVVVAAAGFPAAAAPNRGLVLPTSSTLARGGIDVTLEEIGVPEVTLGVTDRLEVTLGGAWVPGTDLIGGMSSKVKLAESGPWSASSFGGFALDFPELGTRAACPLLGGVIGRHAVQLSGPRSSRSGRDGPFEGASLDVDVVAFVAVPIVTAHVDAVIIVAPSARIDVNEWLSLMGALWLRGVVPERLAGVTLDAGARVHVWKLAFDAGWLIDFGVVGPPLPVVSIPGVPVVSVALAL